MHGSEHFLRNLAMVMGVAALTTWLFQRIRQPVVLGYIIAGLRCRSVGIDDAAHSVAHRRLDSVRHAHRSQAATAAADFRRAVWLLGRPGE